MSTQENIQNIMSKKLITVAEDASLDAAYAVMIKNNIRHLPVTNEDSAVVGVLSDRDLQRALKSHVVGSGLARWESCEFDPQHVVADYMSWPVKTVDYAMPLKEVVEYMIEERVSSLMVSRNGEVVGIVTTIDLLKLLADVLGDEHHTWKKTLETIMLSPGVSVTAQTLANSGI